MHRIDNMINLKSEAGDFQTISSSEFINILEKMYNELRAYENHPIPSTRIWYDEPGWFFHKDETFLKFRVNENAPDTLNTDETIFKRRRGDVTELIARKSGYLVNREGKLTIFEPCRITRDKVRLYFLFFPVIYGKELLIDEFFEALDMPTKDRGIRNYSRERIIEIVNTKEICAETISQGIPAKPGRQERLEIKIVSEKKPAKKTDGSIDYYSYSHFKEVEEGMIIAEKITGINGEAGLDAYGNEISVNTNVPVKFSAGENVLIKEIDDSMLQYIAKENGILDLKENTVNVLSELHIGGDVGPETGSVFFSRNIIIEGNIKPFYKIRCGGDLNVKGQVENGADIECEGNLLAEKGIFGDKTLLSVKGNLETEFITETKLRVNGDVVIHGTVYASEVFCGGSLTVEGKKMKTKNRGCVIGSRITGMKEMNIHSAGSGLSKTELICGIDNEMKKKQDELKKVTPVIDKKILRLQHGLGIDLKRKDLIETLSKLSPERKKQVKKKLQEIKSFALQKGEIEKKIVKMDELIHNPDLENLSINITSHLIPDTIVYIGERTLSVKDTHGPCRIHLSDKSISIST